jgi:hypothetical protein
LFSICIKCVFIKCHYPSVRWFFISHLNITSVSDGPVETLTGLLEPERAGHEEAGSAPRTGEVGAVPAAVRAREARHAIAVVGSGSELEVDHVALDLGEGHGSGTLDVEQGPELQWHLCEAEPVKEFDC